MSERAIRLLDAARDDLRAGKRFYQRLQPGVGTWFWDSLLADIESLHIHAGVHVRQYGYYRLLAQRFPYAVYYEFDSRHITVVAVLPLRRDPVWVAGQFENRPPGH